MTGSAISFQCALLFPMLSQASTIPSNTNAIFESYLWIFVRPSYKFSRPNGSQECFAGTQLLKDLSTTLY